LRSDFAPLGALVALARTVVRFVWRFVARGGLATVERTLAVFFLEAAVRPTDDFARTGTTLSAGFETFERAGASVARSEARTMNLLGADPM